MAILGVALLGAACSSGSGTFAASHAPTGAKTVLVAIGGDEWAGPAVTQPQQDWTQIFYKKSLSARSTLYDLSSESGTTVSDLLSFEISQALALHPDVVTVFVGMNDLLEGVSKSAFEQEMRQALSELRHRGRKVLVANLLPVYTFPDYSTCESSEQCGATLSLLPPSSEMRLGTAGYDAAISAAASASGALLVDLTSAFTKRTGSLSDLVDRTDLGLTAAGEQLVASTFERALSGASTG